MPNYVRYYHLNISCGDQIRVFSSTAMATVESSQLDLSLARSTNKLKGQLEEVKDQIRTISGQLAELRAKLQVLAEIEADLQKTEVDVQNLHDLTGEVDEELKILKTNSNKRKYLEN